MKKTLLLFAICLAFLMSKAQEFTIVVIPDTQFMINNTGYSGAWLNQYTEQTKWIEAQKDALNIVCVIHVGDLVEGGTREWEWDNFFSGWTDIENSGIPWSAVPGNHDCNYGSGDIYDFYNWNMAEHWQLNPGLEETSSPGRYENTLVFFETSGMEFMVIGLQVYPDWNTLNWASEKLEQYPNKRAIINVHYPYLGENVVAWAKQHRNIFMVHSGHDCAREWHNVQYNNWGEPFYDILTDYQCNGNGLLRYYTFNPEDDNVNAYTYSPVYNYYENDWNSEYTFNYDMINIPCTIPHRAYQGNIAPIPGLIEAENYNEGCKNVAYYDNESRNIGGEYRTDGVDIEVCIEGGFNIGYINEGEWLNYEVNVADTGYYDVTFNVAADGTDIKTVQLHSGENILGTATFRGTNDWQTWTGATTTVHLDAGIQNIKIYASSSGFNLNSIEFVPNNGSFTTVIQAEDYSFMYGIQTETCLDIDGGLNVGWLDAGDWMVWDVEIPVEGTYMVEYRVASLYGGGTIQLEKAGGGTIYGTTPVPITHGWQEWETTSPQTVNLPAGQQQIAIYVPSGGYNVNWIRISQGAIKSEAITPASTNAVNKVFEASNIVLYPNPVSDILYVKGVNSNTKLEVYDLAGKKIIEKVGNKLNTRELTKGVYFLSINENNKVNRIKFAKE